MIEFDPILVHEWLRRSAKRHPDKTALVCDSQRWSYRDIDARSDHLAVHLHHLGVGRQDRVAIFLDNCAEEVIALYAVLKAGGIFIILSGLLKGSKLRQILDNAGANVLITHVNKAAVIDASMEEDNRELKYIWIGSPKGIPETARTASIEWDNIFSDFSSGVKTQNDPFFNGLPQSLDIDLAALIYTSGSTGEPKGVMETHHNMIATSRSVIQYLDNNHNDIILAVLPLSFSYGLYQIITAFMFGGTVVLEKSFIYLHKTLQRIAEEKVTGFPMVPTIAAMLLKVQNLQAYDLSSIRYITNAGAAMPAERLQRLRAAFPQVNIFLMYGLTECKRVSYLSPDQADHRPESVGKAMPNCEAFIIDDQGRRAPSGTSGELVVRGANVMQGYWQSLELSTQIFRPGRYPGERLLYTGDLFRSDEEGYLYFISRREDMIKVKGERIIALEVERTIMAMEGVAEAAVIGVSDEILGQVVKAFIVPAPGAELTEKKVLVYCAENMESFAVPKYIQLVEALPLTPSGKVDKRKLADLES